MWGKAHIRWKELYTSSCCVLHKARQTWGCRIKTRLFQISKSEATWVKSRRYSGIRISQLGSNLQQPPWGSGALQQKGRVPVRGRHQLLLSQRNVSHAPVMGLYQVTEPLHIHGKYLGLGKWAKMPWPNALWGLTGQSLILKDIQHTGEKNSLVLVCMRWGKKLASPVPIKQGCCSVTRQIMVASAFNSSSRQIEFSSGHRVLERNEISVTWERQGRHRIQMRKIC